jgi:putative NIF3 family GTP cyclohydrolase 1 type 2
VTRADVAKIIEAAAGPPGSDEGFWHGDPEVNVHGIVVAFMANLDAIARTAKLKFDFLVVHEQLAYPYGDVTPAQLEWPVNRARLDALTAAGIGVYRAHGMLDKFCILDDFGKLLNLPEAAVNEDFYRVYNVQATPVAQVVDRARQRLGLPHLRVTGAMDTMVRRIGLAWGGLGLSVNVAFLNSILAYGCDCLIAGETDEYAQRFCQDAGVVLIETGHSSSEEPGLEHFAGWLGEQVDPVPVVFHRLSPAWNFV